MNERPDVEVEAFLQQPSVLLASTAEGFDYDRPAERSRGADENEDHFHGEEDLTLDVGAHTTAPRPF